MNKTSKFSLKIGEGALRLVREHQGEYWPLRGAVGAIALETGPVPPTLATDSSVKKPRLASAMA